MNCLLMKMGLRSFIVLSERIASNSFKNLCIYRHFKTFSISDIDKTQLEWLVVWVKIA